MKNDRTGTVAANGLRAAARTDCGRQREANEDCYCLDLEAGILLVIDGVGGHAAGEVAARIAHDTIYKRLERQDAAADVRVREAITLANQQILLHARESPARKGMACVLTLAVLEGRRLTIGHVGDTRLYRFTPEGMAKMTHDHSPVGEREDAREISETEAMQHARRNEVYRDVGSEPREPHATDFIETLVTTVDDDGAVLICSDGLSDMLPSLEINRIVRAQAGNPARVVDALVDAANEAGGKDNITVLYVEGPRFARSSGGSRVLPVGHQPRQQVATEALDGLDAQTAEPVPAVAGSPAATSPLPPKAERHRGFVRSHALALAAGMLLGLGAAFAGWYFLLRPLDTIPAAPRELTVDGGAAGGFLTIAEALLQAQDGDVIRVHDGQYAEALELRRAVTLISARPNGAVLVAPPGERAWASVKVWSAGTSLSGFRISNKAGTGHVGIRVHTGDIDVDNVTFEGPMEVGVDAVGAGTRTLVRGSRFNNVSGVPVQVGDGASVTLRQNVFQAAPGAKGPAVACVTAESVTLDANIFRDFAGAPVVAATGPPVIIDPAYVIPPPAPPKSRRR